MKLSSTRRFSSRALSRCLSAPRAELAFRPLIATIEAWSCETTLKQRCTRKNHRVSPFGYLRRTSSKDLKDEQLRPNLRRSRRQRSCSPSSLIPKDHEPFTNFDFGIRSALESSPEEIVDGRRTQVAWKASSLVR